MKDKNQVFVVSLAITIIMAIWAVAFKDVYKRQDTYVTGEYALYSQQYAGFCGMNLFVGSHTNTEILGVKSMAERLTCGGKIELIRIREPND